MSSRPTVYRSYGDGNYCDTGGDSPGQTASDIINVLVPRYFEPGRLHVLMDANGHSNLRHLDPSALSKIGTLTQTALSCPTTPTDKHDPDKLAHAIGSVFFKEYLNSELFLFDYDDTLVGRQSEYPKSSRFNINGIAQLNGHTKIGICTGNTIKALDLRREPTACGESFTPTYKGLLVFADGGVNEYSYNTRPNGSGEESSCPEAVRCISPDVLLPTVGPHSATRIIEALVRAGIPRLSIENRGNALIAIRPIDHNRRRAVMGLARDIVCGSDLEVCESGRTTVEIRKRALSKVLALKRLQMEFSSPPTITYVGDECDSGNDHDVEEFANAESMVKCLHVGSPTKTAFFISTLIAHLKGDVKH